MTGATSNNIPDAAPKTLGDDVDISSNQETTPVPYVAGSARLAITFLDWVRNNYSTVDETKASEGDK